MHEEILEIMLRSDLVFIGGGHQRFLSLLRRLRAADAKLPVVVVTRMAETSEWLEALDAGATDYCAPPFDPKQLRSLVSRLERARAERIASAGSA
jgi:DNA-binding response OmpR family regulator